MICQFLISSLPPTLYLQLKPLRLPHSCFHIPVLSSLLKPKASDLALSVGKPTFFALLSQWQPRETLTERGRVCCSRPMPSPSCLGTSSAELAKPLHMVGVGSALGALLRAWRLAQHQSSHTCRAPGAVLMSLCQPKPGPAKAHVRVWEPGDFIHSTSTMWPQFPQVPGAPPRPFPAPELPLSRCCWGSPGNRHRAGQLCRLFGGIAWGE